MIFKNNEIMSTLALQIEPQKPKSRKRNFGQQENEFAPNVDMAEPHEAQVDAVGDDLIQMAPSPRTATDSLNPVSSPIMEMIPNTISESTMSVEIESGEETEDFSEEVDFFEKGLEGGLPDMPPENEDEAKSAVKPAPQTEFRPVSPKKEDDRGSLESVDGHIGKTVGSKGGEAAGESFIIGKPPEAGKEKITEKDLGQTETSSFEETKMVNSQSASELVQPSTLESHKGPKQSSRGGEPPERKVPAAEAKEGEKTKEVTLQTDSSESMIRSLTSMTATGFAKGMKEASKAAIRLQKEEKRQQQESLPVIDQPTGIPTKAHKKAEAIKLEKGKAPDLEVTGKRQGKQVEIRHKQPEGPTSAEYAPRFREPERGNEEDSGSWWSRLIGRIKSYLNSLPDSDSEVNTSAGKRPKVDLSGRADPKQNNEHKSKSDAKIKENKATAQKETNKDFGEHDIYPDIETEKLSPSTQITGAEPRKEKPFDMRELAPDVRSALNTKMQPRMNDKVAPKNQEFAEAHQKYETDSAKEKEEGLAKIEVETARVKAEQEGQQAKAAKQVNGEREKWRKENEKVKETYEKQSTEKKKEIDDKIDKEVTSAEEKADKKLDKAEEKAEKAKQKVEEKVRKKKQEAENQPRSFWDRVKGAVSDFFDKIRSAINSIFEGLRKLVKNIIEAAKKVVNGIIELARKAIVGLIKAFGEALKKFVSIALAAFPELAKKARAAIDKAVSKAVDTVNKAARALKDFANKVLNAIGAALDFIISVYQKFYNTVLDALEFIAVGIIEIIEGMANLVAAARQMPSHFWGQVSEELLGMDVTKPLPAIERKEPKKHLGQGIGMAPSSSVVDPATQKLLKKSELSETDVVIDPVPEIELPPELFSSVIIPEGEEIMFGREGEGDLTIDELRALTEGETGAQVENTEGMGGEVSTPDGGSDFAGMSDEDKMDFYLSQMKPQCNDMKGEQPTGESDSSIPDEAKVGPLSVSQRAGFVLEQVKIGIGNWWECNKIKIISIMVGALLALGVAAFFTGGAAIAAALQVLMTALTVIFGAVLIARMSYHFGLYLKQAWSGDIEAGAKSLARAIAVGLVELVFNFIFKVGGVLLKVVKKVAKTVAKAAKATGKFAMKTAKATGKLALKTGKALGKGAIRITKRAARPLVKKGKVFINGIKRGFGKGIKSLDDLGKKLKRHFGFKGFSMKIKGSRFFLYGHFNPKKLLATGNIKKLTDTETERLRKIGDNQEIVGKSINTGGKKAIVVSDDFARKLDEMTPAERAAKFKELENMSPEKIRKLSGSGKSTYKLRKGIKGEQPKNYQAHHIIPEELYNNPAIKKFLDDIGFNIQDGARNGLMLPPSKSARFGKWSDASIHSGYHSKYSRKIKEQIERIRLSYRRTIEQGLPAKEAREKALDSLNDLAARTREKLMKGEIELN